MTALADAHSKLKKLRDGPPGGNLERPRITSEEAEALLAELWDLKSDVARLRGEKQRREEKAAGVESAAAQLAKDARRLLRLMR